MTFDEISSYLTDKFGADVILKSNAEAIDPWIEVAAESIARVAAFLKTDSQLKFDSLCNLCGVDYLETDEKLAAKFPYDVRLEVVYHLLSLTHRHKLTVKVPLPRWKNDEVGQLPVCPTVSHVWSIADWHERECFDLMGVSFVGHPNQVRILCADDWVGHPLRKDYVFPEEYHGVRNI